MLSIISDARVPLFWHNPGTGHLTENHEAAGMPKLQIKTPYGGAHELQLTADLYSLGRSSDNDIVVEDSGVSRRHGRLVRDGDGYRVLDLGSHNGTFVNGQKVTSATLQDRDQIQVGQHTLTYVLRDSEPSIPIRNMTVSLEVDYDQIVSQITRQTRAAETLKGDVSLLTQLQKEQHTLRLLFELGNAISTLNTVETVAQKAVEILVQTTRAERAALFMVEGEQNKLTPVVVQGRPGRAVDKDPVVLSSTIAGKILTERKGIITADALSDDRFAHGQSVAIQGLRSIACAPLLGKSGSLGIVYLENKSSIGAFQQDDLKLLCAVANQIGLAIENARLFDALRRHSEALEKTVEERTAALQKTQLRLFQTEKLASLSRLVAGVAHEINNPLGALKSNLELLMVMFGRAAATPDRPKDEQVLFQHLVGLGQDSVTACARIVGVVRALSSFARLDEADFKKADINEGIRTVVQLLDPVLRRKVNLKLELGQVPQIICFPALLNEALMNLLVNACQSIKSSGQVTVVTSRDSEQVVISICDTGSGIPKEHLGKIFEAGFTTRKVGTGAGLGLAVVSSVIKEHGGTIEVESELDRGSTFRIRLPITPPGMAKTA
jgi:signal transduction histidine kinase